nr:hypothetical protein [Humibacter ginsenosidimutans]
MAGAAVCHEDDHRTIPSEDAFDVSAGILRARLISFVPQLGEHTAKFRVRERVASARIVGTVAVVDEFDDAAIAERRSQPGRVLRIHVRAMARRLALHGDEGTTATRLQSGEARNQLVEPTFDGTQVPEIDAAEANAFSRSQPGGQAAVVPARVDVRAGLHNDIETRITSDQQVSLDVAPIIEAWSAFDRLMKVPSDGGVQRVDAEIGQAGHAVLPLRRMHAKVVHASSDHLVSMTAAVQCMIRGDERRVDR